MEEFLKSIAVGDKGMIAIIIAFGLSFFLNECANRETYSHTIYQCERSCLRSPLMSGVEVDGDLICRCQ